MGLHHFYAVTGGDMYPQDFDYNVIDFAGIAPRIVLATDDREEAVSAALALPLADVRDTDPDEGGWLRVRPIPLAA